mmetsp:Transcript_124975/g.314613  ORF Transcript_124975/g.314613 Transcript_124975/m.314613 type:complete len:775 (+) Transcript_124975:66-2390(+)
MAEEAEGLPEPVEEWVALTQNTLGQLIAKPRMLPERLRKPPFRFLFDVAVEVARQTGFGTAELFAGDLAAKPALPSTREAKVEFLEAWSAAVGAAIGAQGISLANVSAQNIVCGTDPAWTNFLLQCTAAAAWPDCCSPPPPPVIDPVATVVTAEAPEPSQPPLPTSAEQGQAAIPGTDFTSYLQQLEQAQEEFARTASAWRTTEVTAEDQAGAADAAHPTGEESSERPATAAQAPLLRAAETSSKVNEEIQRAQALLDQMEEALDGDEEEMIQRRAKAAQARADLEAAKQREAQQAAELADARARKEREEEDAYLREEEQQKAEKEAAKARRRAEKQKEKEAAQAAEEAAKRVYPVSKASAAQGTRMVAAFGAEDEYAWDGDDADADATAPAAQPDVPAPPEKAEVASAETGYVDAMSACFSDAILGDGPSKTKVGGFDFAAAEAAFDAGSSGTNGKAESKLFEQLKAELKDTFISYLSASMPESLLRKYQPDDLISCLQFLLRELRKCLANHNLGDVDEEEPTSLAEELRESIPNGGWLEHLLSTSPWALRQRYDVPELIDTLQGLAGTCSDRLGDELGPISQWAPEDSPLRKMPDLPPPMEETVQGNLGSTWGSRDSAASPVPASTGQWSAELAPAPWEAGVPAAAAAVPPPTAGARPITGMASTGSRLATGAPPPTRGGSVSPAPAARRASPSPTRAPASSTAAPPPVFSASLGPALWEQEAFGMPATSGPATASKARTATTSRFGATAGGPRPPLMSSTGVGWSSTARHG